MTMRVTPLMPVRGAPTRLTVPLRFPSGDAATRPGISLFPPPSDLGAPSMRTGQEAQNTGPSHRRRLPKRIIANSRPARTAATCPTTVRHQHHHLVVLPFHRVELRTVAAVAAADLEAAHREARTLLVEVGCRIPVEGREERRMGIVVGWRVGAEGGGSRGGKV